jgi:hypothetical protein
MDEPTESPERRLLELMGIVLADETLEASLDRDSVDWPSTKASWGAHRTGPLTGSA